jgi:ubiquinone/menaquinone biosynthesis C-methylase UbiE
MRTLLKKMFNKFDNLQLKPHTTSSLIAVKKDDIESVLADSWRDPSVPGRQYEACTKIELENYRNGIPVIPFDVMVDMLRTNINNFTGKKLLEIGCSTGYYSEVLKIQGIDLQYYGCDYSEYFIRFAQKTFPGINFQIQDACSLTYPDGSFDIAVSGCCLLHIMNFEKAIAETARVAKDFAIFHRTPVLHTKETSYFIKTAYGVKMFEIHFNERELLRLIRKYNLKVVDIITFQASFEKTIGDFYAYKTYLCEKT